jgi:hypothetical protein
MATGFGLKAVRTTGGGELRVRPYVIPASDSTIYGVGDVVKLAAGFDTTAGLPTIVAAAAGDALVGAIVGFEGGNPASPLTGDYRPASTRVVALVCDDPDAVFQVQEDGVSNVVTAANVGASFNADLIISVATATTRESRTMLDSDTAAATSAQVKIIGILRDGTNAAAQTAGAILEVVILEHALRVTDSIT